MPKARTPYSVHPSVAMVRKWIADLPTKTGRSLDQWIHFIPEQGPGDTKGRKLWLKKEFGVGTNIAGWLVDRAEGNDRAIGEGDPEAYLASAERYVETMFAGPKAALRPIYDRILELVLELGPDVKICPCMTIVPFYRNYQFAQIKPTTRTRIDLGLALKDLPAQGRLIDTGGFIKKDRITHRIPIAQPEEIDAEVIRWLRTAYDRDS